MPPKRKLPQDAVKGVRSSARTAKTPTPAPASASAATENQEPPKQRIFRTKKSMKQMEAREAQQQGKSVGQEKPAVKRQRVKKAQNNGNDGDQEKPSVKRQRTTRDKALSEAPSEAPKAQQDDQPAGRLESVPKRQRKVRNKTPVEPLNEQQDDSPAGDQDKPASNGPRAAMIVKDGEALGSQQYDKPANKMEPELKRQRTANNVQDIEATKVQQDDNLADQEEPAPKRRRTAGKKKQDDQYLFDDEMNEAMDAHEFVQEGNQSDEYVPNSPPAAAPFSLNLPTIPELLEDESTTPIDHSDDNPEPLSPAAKMDLIKTAHIDENVFAMADTLREQPEIQVDLPEQIVAGDVEKPWTATDLTHLYIVCYQGRDWNTCDLITDTWIRAFRKLPGDRSTRIWRNNKRPYVDPDAPDYHLDVLDPALDDSVTDFNSRRINELFNHTARDCGARMVWADAMALCGDKLAVYMAGTDYESWSQEVLGETLQSTLWLVRRHLTLKIEEGTEGAWCQRYHEHYKHGHKCYRELAKEEEEEKQEAAKNARRRGRHVAFELPEYPGLEF
ncbi:hypothetical protein BS50DRAFT_670925 [Corynespora cassiicola Philippines]|uniref:Uncharacterized protein n=1 Tax=Corynespora cassiicola Philippines TaxID=1448308 RepID=A0A2T2PA76_CORCC|nr:hypothetical protein BS50DRAFT_670925 [Corynespora cassiicola Philippines]